MEENIKHYCYNYFIENDRMNSVELNMNTLVIAFCIRARLQTSSSETPGPNAKSLQFMDNHEMILTASQGLNTSSRSITWKIKKLSTGVVFKLGVGELSSQVTIMCRSK